MKIVYSSKTTVDIEYNSKKARFYGELGMIGFRADASSMRWMAPKRDAPVSQEEREELIKAVNEYCANMKNSVFFVDDNGNEVNYLEN